MNLARNKSVSIFKRVISFMLAFILAVSGVLTNFGQGATKVQAAGNFEVGKTYTDYGTCTISVPDTGSGNGWTFKNFSSTSGNGVNMNGLSTSSAECASHRSGGDAKSAGVTAPNNGQAAYYYATGTTVSDNRNGKKGVRIDWTVYAAPTTNCSRQITSYSEWKACTPNVRTVETITHDYLSSSAETVYHNNSQHFQVRAFQNVKDSDGHAIQVRLEAKKIRQGNSDVYTFTSLKDIYHEKLNDRLGTDAGSKYTITFAVSSMNSCTATLTYTKLTRKWNGNNGYRQLGMGSASEWRPLDVEISFVKEKSASQVPAGLEDSLLYTPSQSTGTKTSFKVAYDDGKGNVTGGKTITLDNGVWRTSDNSGSKKISLDASLLDKTWYVTEIVTPNSNYSVDDNPTTLSYKIDGETEYKRLTKVNDSKSKFNGWYKIGAIGSTNAGKSITISATNICHLLDPLVSVHKTLPNGNIAEVVGVKYRVQYYDTLDSSNDNKYFYLSALSADSVKKAAAGKNASNTASKYYSDAYINDSNIYPNNVSKVKSALNQRVTDATARAAAGSLALSDYNSDNYRDWVFKTVSSTVYDKNGKAIKVGALQFNKESIAKCYAGSYSGNDKLYTQNGQVIAPAGTYVITEFEGNDSYYSNAMSVIILKISNKPNGDTTYTSWIYEADGSNADATVSKKSGKFTAAVVIPNGNNSISQENFSTSMADLPKAGSLTVEKSLDDNGLHMDGHADSHDGDNDANVTDMTVTMALYYKDTESNPSKGYYYPSGIANTNKNDVVEFGRGKKVCSFTVTKKSKARNSSTYPVTYPSGITENNTLKDYVYDFADMSLSAGEYYIIEEKVAPGMLNNHTAKNPINVTVRPDERTFKTMDVKFTDSKKDESVENSVIHGQVFVRKVVKEVDTLAGSNASGIGEGDAHLSGGIFKITNRSANAAYVHETKKWYNKGEVIGYMTTGEDGTSSVIYSADSYANGKVNTKGTKIILPYGDYEIQEIKAPNGLQIDTTFNTNNTKADNYIKIRENNQVFKFEYAAGAKTVAKEPIDRGGFSIEKVDAETGLRIPMGNSAFDNARFVIKNLSDYPVWVDLNGDGKETDDEWFAGTSKAGVTSNGTVIQPVAGGTDIVNTHNKYAVDKNGKSTDAYTFRLDALSYDGNPGYFASTADFLPYGTYEIREVSSVDTNDPTGYHINSEWRYTLELRKDKQWDSITVESDKNHTVTVKGEAIPDTVARGGFQIQKYDKEDHSITSQGDTSLEGGVFAIYNTSSYKDAAFYDEMNGYVVTDIDGDGTISDTEKATRFTSVTDEQINEAIANGLNTSDWSGTDNAGNAIKPCLIIKTDKHGIAKTSSIALPFGDYVVREVQAPEGYHVDRNFNMHVIVTDEVETVTETSVSTDTRSEYMIPCDITGDEYSGKMSVITGVGANYKATPVDYDDDRFNALDSESKSSVYDAVVRGSFALQKVDEDDYEAYKKGEKLYLDSDGKYVIEPQGDARFANAKFRVINRSKSPIYTLTYDATGESVYTKYDVDDVVWTFMTDDNGYYEAPDDLLPYGTYEIQETDASEGYLVSDEKKTFTIGYEDNGSKTIININDDNKADTPENDLVLSMDGYTITKIAAGKYQILNKATGKVVANKKFDINNAAGNDDIYIWTNGVTGPSNYTKYAAGDKIYSISTDKNGIFTLRQLTAGQYGTDYTISGDIKGTLHVSLDEFTSKFFANLTTNDNYDLTPVEEPVMRGGVEVLKVDEDDFTNTGAHNGAQGDASLEGAEFSIYNISDRYVWVSDEKGNWRRTYPATTDGKWIPQDDVEADVVYDPDEALTRIAWDKINSITSTGMTNKDKSTASDNGAYTDTINAFNGATSADVIEKYHQNDLARLGNNDLQDLLVNTVPVKKIYTDRNGYAKTGNRDLPYGTYAIVETKSSTGYMLPRCWYRIVEVREDGHLYTWEETNTSWTPNVDTKETLEPVIRGDVQITKFDKELDESNALNNAALDGIEFKIYNVSDSYSYLWELTDYKNEPLVDTNDEKYNTPLKIVNSDYFNPDSSDFWRQLDSDPSNYVTTIVTKWNPSTQSYTAETYMRNEDGTKKDVNEDGTAIRGALPYGTYIIRESKTNTKYEFTDEEAWIFQIREEGDVVTIGFQSGDTSASNKAHQITFKDLIERNDVWFNKIGDGNSVRMDTMWVIKNEDTGERHVIVTNGGSDDDNNGNGTYESGADVNAHTYHTNANDKFLEYIDANNLLESGTPFITEKDAKANGNDANKAVAITMGSENKHVQTEDRVVPGQKEPEKVVISDDGLNNNGMGYAEYDAGTWFGWCEFTSEKDGTSVNPYILNGSSKEEIITVDETTGEKIILHWADPDDSLKAFPYGHYTISEVRTDTNADYTLQKYAFTINNSNTDLSKWASEIETSDREVDLGTITDDFPPIIETELIDAETNSHLFCADDKTTLIETVKYQFFGGDIFKKNYKAKGELYVLSDDGKSVVGDPIATAYSDTFQLKVLSGDVEIEYKDVDTSKYEGKTLVSYAYLYKVDDNGKEVLEASHDDAGDTDEQVTSPIIKTVFAAAITGDKDVPVGTDVTLRDTVTASNLSRGRYAVSGTLMTVDADGNAVAVLDANGNEITATSPYVYVGSGETEKNFTLTFNHVDTTKYQGSYFVAYAELLVNDIEVAIHHDMSDKDETVYIPEIHTDAIDGISGDQQGVCLEKDSITDTISYANLTAGKQYKLVGELAEIDADGNATPIMTGDGEESKPITAESVFTPDETSGKTKVTFDIDSRTYAGKTIVVYETLYASVVTDADKDSDKESDKDSDNKNITWIELVSHKDSADTRQMVHYPEIHTTAVDKNTNTKSALAIKDTEIIDTITYKNLIPGNSYIFYGTLMTKDADGNATEVLNNGKPVTAKTDAITVDKADGTQDVVFKFDATDYKGKDIVVYEKLLSGKNKDIEYTQHEDIEDDGQTVHYPEIGTTAKDSQTGENFGYATENTTIIDTVHYKNLVSGITYELVGTLYDKETGKPVGVESDVKATATDADANTETDADESSTEKYVTNTVQFTATGKDGDIDVPLTFNALNFKGRDVVVFEKLYVLKPDGTKVEIPLAQHEDIEDEGQTVHYPEIGTEAFDAETFLHETEARTDLVITDKVRYTNVVPGIEYTVTGKLMNAKTEQPITDAAGNEVTSTVTVVPTEKNGVAEVEFKFDASLLRGETAVAFETWSYKDFVLAVHADIKDAPQTVYFPDIKTTATSQTSGSKLLDPIDVEIIEDEIHYSNVIVGHKYLIKGSLIDVATGEALKDADGKEIANSVEFTAETTEGSIKMDFGKLKASELKGKSIVVYEALYNVDGKDEITLVKEHVTTNTDQTVTVTEPTVKTVLAETDTNNKAITANETVKLTDTIEYKGLIPGNTYKTVSTLVDAKTGKTIQDKSGKDIVIEATVTPDKDVVVGTATFEFDGSNLAGKTVVAYEDVYRVIDGKDYLVAQERDLKNTDQTVTFPEIKTTATSQATGTHTLEMAEKAVIVDRVTYSGLEPGHTYTLKATPMDKTTNKALDGVEPVTYEFTPGEADGYVDMMVTVDATKLAGHKIVMFETLYEDKREIVIHADINDEDQTVSVMSVDTKATGNDGKSKTVPMAKDTVIKDTVTFTGLTPGKTYVISGEVYSREQYTGTAVEKLNNESTTENPSNGQTGNGSMTGGTEFKTEGTVKTAVSNGVTVETPLTVGDTTAPGNRMELDKVAVTKTSNKLNLIVQMHMTSRVASNTLDTWTGSMYCLDKDANLIQELPLSVKGIKNATKTNSFTTSVTIPSTTVKVLVLENKTSDILNPLPADPMMSVTENTTETAKAQTVVEEVTTTATTEAATTEAPAAGNDSSRQGSANTENPYNVKPLATNTIEFTPKTADGEVTIEFTVDTTKLDGHHLVCFETVTDKESNVVLGEHKDINDEDQTVTVKTTTTVQTGVNRFGFLFAILAIMMLIATAGMFFYLKNKRASLVSVKADNVIRLDDRPDNK